MKTFLQKLRLYDEFEMEIDISKNEFITTFQNHIDKKPGWFFSSNKKEFIGKINNKGFKVKLKREFINLTMNTAVAKGILIEKNNKLIIRIIIEGFPYIMFFFYGLCTFIYGVAIIQLIKSGKIYTDYYFLGLMVHAVLMLGLPYLMLLSGTESLKKDLEKRFTYFSK